MKSWKPTFTMSVIRKILVPEMSPSNFLRMSLKILFDHPGDFLTDVLGMSWINLSGTSLGKRFWDVPWRTFKGRFIGTMWGRLLDVPKFLFTFLSDLIRLTQIYLKTIQYSERYLELSQISKMELFLRN